MSMNTINDMSLIGLPRKVLNLNSNTENGSIQWDQPYNGGENISHYTVSHVFGSETWNTTQTFFCFLVLSSGEYNISVQAVNCHGKGEPIFISIKVEIPFIICNSACICNNNNNNIINVKKEQRRRK